MVDRDFQPLFIFSLPRSGSTLLQRILATSAAISTTSEPWILLPYLYTLRRNGVHTEYRHEMAVQALEDFVQTLPEGRDDYLAEIGAMARRLYEKASSPEARFFLDKTPRYHLIVEEILELFPEGRFVFLWRNPLAIAASIMNTWAEGKWNLFRHRIDLESGLIDLIDAVQKHGDRVFTLRYEDLVVHPNETGEQLFAYLGIDFDSSIADRFSHVGLTGRMGDDIASSPKSISSESLETWKESWGSPLRKAQARRYLSRIGADRLALIGYPQQDLLRDLDLIPTSWRGLWSDAFRMLYGGLYSYLDRMVVSPAMRNSVRRRMGMTSGS
jgi:hypothetical protein